MIRLDFQLASNIASTGLPEDCIPEIHLGKGVSLLGLFRPNGERQELRYARHDHDPSTRAKTSANLEIKNNNFTVSEVCNRLQISTRGPGDCNPADGVGEKPSSAAQKWSRLGRGWLPIPRGSRGRGWDE
jgi:hypothetical protein